MVHFKRFHCIYSIPYRISPWHPWYNYMIDIISEWISQIIITISRNNKNYIVFHCLGLRSFHKISSCAWHPRSYCFLTKLNTNGNRKWANLWLDFQIELISIAFLHYHIICSFLSDLSCILYKKLMWELSYVGNCDWLCKLFITKQKRDIYDRQKSLSLLFHIFFEKNKSNVILFWYNALLEDLRKDNLITFWTKSL